MCFCRFSNWPPRGGPPESNTNLRNTVNVVWTSCTHAHIHTRHMYSITLTHIHRKTHVKTRVQKCRKSCGPERNVRATLQEPRSYQTLHIGYEHSMGAYLFLRFTYAYSNHADTPLGKRTKQHIYMQHVPRNSHHGARTKHPNMQSRLKMMWNFMRTGTKIWSSNYYIDITVPQYAASTYV